MKATKASITISRQSDDKVVIRICDKNSRIEFFELALSLEDYALAITGLGNVTGEVKYRALQYVGKHKVQENRQIRVPVAEVGDWYADNKANLKEWLIDFHEGDGWIVDTYLNSQKSVDKQGDTLLVNYSVYKYVDSLE